MSDLTDFLRDQFGLLAVVAGEQLEIELLYASIAACIGSRRIEEVSAEIDRRAALFGEHWASLPFTRESPRTQALRSVLHDAQMGWLG